MIIFKKKRKYFSHEIDPDEIFLDSENLPQFDNQQFEGRLEKPITSRTVIVLGVFFVLIGVLFTGRLGILQIRKGTAYAERSENNSLNKKPIFAHRGIIYDRDNKELAWNEEAQNGDEYPHRAYISTPGFAHVLGYMSYPQKDKNGFYYKVEAEGKDGVEKYFNTQLSGVNGLKIEETDAQGNSLSENATNPPIDGQNLVLSIDAGIQAKLYEAIASYTGPGAYRGGAGVIMDIRSGEIVALTSYPEYSPSVLSLGDDSEKINEYFNDSRKPFLNRAVAGSYTPGSIVKPFIGVAALNEGVINATKNILSNGSISIPNPYFPDQKSVFKDHGVFGYVDMQKAIAISSDVYFYEIGGGFQDQAGLGIAKIDSYARMFGIAEETHVNLPGEISGVIPTPEWKEKNFKGDAWRVGDTYNTSIGQYGFQVTPIQMVRAIGAIANKGTLVIPTILKNNGVIDETTMTPIVGIKNDAYGTVHAGMRRVITEGTAQILNVPYIKVAGKTGTAQVGISKQNINSWIVGFFPYEDPKYAFVVLMDYAPKNTTFAASHVMRKVLDYIDVSKSSYLE
jgi:penicillin-binding protein 2